MQAPRQSSLLGGLLAVVLMGGVGCGVSDPLLGAEKDAGPHVDGGTDGGFDLDAGDSDGGTDADAGDSDGGADAGSPPFGTFAIGLTTQSPVHSEEASFTVSDCGTATEILINDGDIPDAKDAGWQKCVTDVSAIKAALTTGGMHWLRVWVKDMEGQVFEFTSRFTVVRGSMFATGDAHTCALVAGSVKCWGSNVYGQLGIDSTDTSSAVAVTVPGFDSDVTEIAGGLHSEHVCALKGGEVSCWGRNYGGQIGDPSVTTPCKEGETTGCTRKPVSVVDGAGAKITDVVSISAGMAHTCAQKKDGSIWCWGDNSYGQLLTGVHDVPRLFATKADAVAGDTATIATMGALFTCSFTPAGLVCAGLDYTNVPPADFGPSSGLLGVGSSETCTNSYLCSGKPVLPAALQDAVAPIDQVAAGYYHACAMVAGKVKCWGANHLGQYGDGSVAASLGGALVTLSDNADLIASGAHHACARLPGGKLSCWGLNDFGQLGSTTAATCWTNNSSCSRTALPVEGIEGVAAVAAGRTQTCAAADGKVWCWGGDDSGELGAPATDVCPDDLGRPRLCSRQPLAVPGVEAR